MCVCVVPHSDGVDVAGVSREGLLAGSFPHVPQLGQGVAGSGDEGVLVGGQSQGHAVSNVVGEDDLLLAGLQVPQAAGEQNKFVLCYYLILYYLKSEKIRAKEKKKWPLWPELKT